MEFLQKDGQTAGCQTIADSIPPAGGGQTGKADIPYYIIYARARRTGIRTGRRMPHATERHHPTDGGGCGTQCRPTYFISQALGCTFQALGCTYQTLGYTSQSLGYKILREEKNVSSRGKWGKLPPGYLFFRFRKSEGLSPK